MAKIGISRWWTSPGEAVAHALQVEDADDDRDDRSLGPLPKGKEQAGDQQRAHGQIVQPRKVVVDAEMPEIPDRPGIMELWAERVDLQDLIELKIEIHREAETKVQPYRTQGLRREPAEEEAIDERAAAVAELSHPIPRPPSIRPAGQ